MAELVEDDGEGIAALQQGLLLIEVPRTAVDVERADALRVAEGGILRVEIGAILLRRRRDQAEIGLVDVGRHFIFEAQDLRIFAQGGHHLLLLERVPAEGRQRIDAIVGGLAEALAGQGEVDLQDIVLAGIHVVGAIPDERVERIEGGEVDFLGGDRIAAGIGIIGLDIEIIGAAFLREEGNARADVAREADIVILRDQAAVRIVEEDPGIELAGRQVEPVRFVIGAARHLDRVEFARLDGDRIGVGLAGEEIDERIGAVDEAVGHAVHGEAGGTLERVGDDVLGRLEDDVERILPGQPRARIGFDVDKVGAGIRGGEGEQRIGARAAVVVQVDQLEGVVEQGDDGVAERVRAAAVDRNHVGLAGDHVEREQIEVTRRVDRVVEQDGGGHADRHRGRGRSGGGRHVEDVADRAGEAHRELRARSLGAAAQARAQSEIVDDGRFARDEITILTFGHGESPFRSFRMNSRRTARLRTSR